MSKKRWITLDQLKTSVMSVSNKLNEQIATLKQKLELVQKNQKQPDWNQNDDTQPDYVKNRPFYTGDPVETVLVEESTIEFFESNGAYAAEFPSTFDATVGETYKVFWDGIAYECICVTVNGDIPPLIGNLSVIELGSDTGEPFVMGVINGQGMFIYTRDTSDSHTISISGFVREVVKLDEKYLPENIATKSDVEAAQTAAATAQTTANSAKATADNAQTMANSAKATANSAVRYNTAQNLTDAQKQQVRTNIGAGTSSFSGRYNDLTGKPTIVQSDWEVNNDSDMAYIKNRTHYDYTEYTQITFLNRPTASSLINDIYYYGETTGGSLPIREGNIYRVYCSNGTTYISTCKDIPIQGQPIAYKGHVLGNARLGADAGYLDITNPNYPITDADTGEPWCFISYTHTSKNAIISTIPEFSISRLYVQNVHELKQLDEKYIPSTIQRVGDDLILSSSTADSTKKFRITVDDSGLVQSVDKDTGSVYGTMAPAVTAEDDGKFLRVRDGQWAAVAITNAEEVSF